MFLAFVFLPTILFAQNNCVHSLSGKVVDLKTRKGLSGATVFIPELKIGISADQNGNFKVDSLCSGSYTFVVQHLGCMPQQASIAIPYPGVWIVSLDHKDFDLHEVVISNYRSPSEKVLSSSSIDVVKLESKSGNSIAELLRGEAGINTLRTGSGISKPILHGLHSNRLILVNNGIRQEGQNWGTDHAPEIDAFLAKNISVINGAGSLRFGSDALVGAILIAPEPILSVDKNKGEAIVGFHGNNRQFFQSAFYEGTAKQLFGLKYRIQGTLKNAGNYRSANTYYDNTGFREQNFSVGLGYVKNRLETEVFYSYFHTKIGIFAGAHIGNTTDLQRIIEMGEAPSSNQFSYDIGRPYQDVDHHLLKFKTQYFFKKQNGNLGFIYGIQENKRKEFDKHLPRNNNLAALNLPELDYEIATHNTDKYISLEINNKHSFLGGLQGLYQANVFNGRFFIPNFRNLGAGAYGILTSKYKHGKADFALRYDYKQINAYFYQNNQLNSPIRTFSGFSGSSAISYLGIKDLAIEGHIGYNWRPPAPNELYSDGLHHGAAAIEKGNANLNPEYSFNYDVKLTYQKADKFKIGALFYSNHINNFIYLQPRNIQLSIRGAFPSFNYEQANSQLSGMDFNFEMVLNTSTTLSGKSSVLRARNLETNDWIILMPADRHQLEIKYSRPFQVKQHKMSGSISPQIEYVGKQFRVPLNTDFSDSPEAYTLFHLDASLAFGKNEGWKLGIRLDNALNNEYKDYLNRLRYFMFEPGRNLMLNLKIPI